MKIIKIKKNGKLLLEEHDENGVKVKKTKTLKENLACEVEFESGLTFGTFFKLILKEKDFFDIVFTQELNEYQLKDFEKKLDEVVEVYKEDYKLEYLEISKIFELFNYEKGSTIDLFSVFIGMGKTNDGFDVFIPLSLCTVNELKDLEILPNKLVDIYKDIEIEEGGEIEEDAEGDGEEDEYNEEEGGEESANVLFEAETRITLYEAIQCILYEIAYYKSDEERKKTRLNQNNEHINKSKISILEKQLSRYIENEEFESAASTKKELDRIKAVPKKNKN